MNYKSQKGSAMILTIILIAVLSVMTASMMFLSQSETWSTHNFKIMSQARDAAEAGLSQSAHFIMNHDENLDYYFPPMGADIALFDRNVYPVTDFADPVVLTAGLNESEAAYPDVAAGAADVLGDYDAAAQGSITAGNQMLTYETSARLVGMRQVTLYGSGTPKVLQRWEISSKGSLNGIENAEVEVSAILDHTAQPTFGFAAFGTSDTCTPVGLTFDGNTLTDSYNSHSADPGIDEGPCDPTLPLAIDNCAWWEDAGGNIGTFGALDTNGSVDINGTLATPREGEGSCEEGFAVDNPDVLLDGEDGIVPLPETVEFPPPEFPIPTPPIVAQSLPNNVLTCLGFAVAGSCQTIAPLPTNKFRLLPTCATQPCDPLTSPFVYGEVDGGPGAAKEIHLIPGVYNFNKIIMGSNLKVYIDPVPGSSPPVYGTVTINIAGCDTYNATGDACATYDPEPLSASLGGASGFVTPTLDASLLQIQYAGTGELGLKGNGSLAAVVYAPNARVESVGNAAFYGSVIGHEIDWTGTAAIHYDRALENEAISYGPWMLQGFTWKKF